MRRIPQKSIFSGWTLCALIAFLSPVAYTMPQGLQDLLATVEGPKSLESPRFQVDLDGYIRFLGMSPGGVLPVSSGAKSGDSEGQALAFLEGNRALLGVEAVDWDFSVESVRVEGDYVFVRFQQTYAGVPVYAAEAMVQLKGSAGVSSVLADVARDPRVPEIDAISLIPSVDAAEASTIAAGVKLPKGIPSATLYASSDPELVLYVPEVVGRSGAIHLAWRVTVTCPEPALVNEAVFVDAHDGTIFLHSSLVRNARTRAVYDAENTSADPGTLKRLEGSAASTIADVNQAYTCLGYAYDFFKSQVNRDSVDNAGKALSATTRYCDPYDVCPMQNAYWSGSRFYFGESFISDDVVGHEYAHAINDYTAKLESRQEAGAIAESLSDVWGEFVDLSNSTGNDSAAVRWIIGEDIPYDITLQHMDDPTLDGSPDSYYSPYYYSGYLDDGGVHTNAGVNNKLCYLLTDGDVFKGRTITGLGIATMADVYYYVQTALTTGADYADLYAQITQAGVSLGLTQTQRNNIERACRAVEIAPLPDPVTSLTTATADEDPNITVSWTNPSSSFVNVVVRRKAGSFPMDAADGDGVYAGTGTSVVDGPLTVGTKYYYAAWAYYGVDGLGDGSYSPGAYATAKAGVIPPSDYFTEFFDENFGESSDLNNVRISFMPAPIPNGYYARTQMATTFPTSTSAQTALSLRDDGVATITLNNNRKIRFFGENYGTFYISSNGFISFRALSAEEVYPDVDLSRHFGEPRISGLFTDFNPQTSGSILWKQFDDRVVVTFSNVSDISEGMTTPNSNNFQIEMFFNGVISITYLAMASQHGIAGLASGDTDGVPRDLVESDLTGYSFTDSDGDGISNAVEGTGDTDLDGTPDYLDLDSDGDGIPDATEIASDVDGDGIGNFQDDDSDGDGIGDLEEGVVDSDSDNVSDYLDMDSDGDGIADVIETAADTDGDGTPNYLDLDSDDDGLSDRDEHIFGSNPYDAGSTAELPLSRAALVFVSLALASTAVLVVGRSRVKARVAARVRVGERGERGSR